jgi:hypothetical protein
VSTASLLPCLALLSLVPENSRAQPAGVLNSFAVHPWSRKRVKQKTTQQAGEYDEYDQAPPMPLDPVQGQSMCSSVP